MKKAAIKFLSDIYWFFYKMTPKGKKAFILNQGFAGILESKKTQNITKFNAIKSAKKLLKPRKIIAFHKGKSITKSKKTNHQVIDQVAKKHKNELTQRGLTITNKGKFKHA